MKLQVDFAPPSFTFVSESQRRNNLLGKGFILLNDTSLTISGNLLSIHFMWKNPFQKLFYVSAMRTVPYGVILNYQPAGILSRRHRIIYALPDKKKVKVYFQLVGQDSKRSKEFAERLQAAIQMTRATLK